LASVYIHAYNICKTRHGSANQKFREADMSSYLIKCVSCGKANRIPDEKEGVAGRCGNCKATLPPLYYQPQKLTDQSVVAFLRAYPGPVLAEFWAPW